MQLDDDACYKAIQAKDARFDGTFFTAVRTTGIFCRPVCPAPLPKRGNVTFFPTAAAAALAGYRPCLRCRPESAPASLVRNGTLNTVNRALRLLETGSADDLPDRLGVSGRHLRRLFRQHLGAAPRDVEIAGRVLLAKTLLSGTRLPITQIAFASGFASVRRFNDAMRRMYRMNPSELRRNSASETGAAIELQLGYVAPYDWKRFLAFLKPRQIAGLEQIEDGVLYRRLRFPEGDVEVRAAPKPAEHALLVSLSGAKPSSVREIVERVRSFFDLRCDPERVRQHLRPSLDMPRGLRVPGSWDRFEAAVRAVLGQQVSVKAATTFASRLCDRCGGFPTPEQLAEVSFEGVGLTARRADTLRAMAAAIAEGAHTLNSQEEIAKLGNLPGIGRWTTEYIALRCGEPDAFPEGDLLLKAYGDGGAWRPWRSYAAMTIWTKGILQ